MSERTQPKWNFIVTYITGENETFPSDHDELVASALIPEGYVFTEASGEEHHVRLGAMVKISRVPYSRSGYSRSRAT